MHMEIYRDALGQLQWKPPPEVNEEFLNSLNQNRRLQWERPPKYNERYPSRYQTPQLPKHIGLTAPFNKQLWGFPAENERAPEIKTLIRSQFAIPFFTPMTFKFKVQGKAFVGLLPVKAEVPSLLENFVGIQTSTHELMQYGQIQKQIFGLQQKQQHKAYTLFMHVDRRGGYVSFSTLTQPMQHKHFVPELSNRQETIIVAAALDNKHYTQVEIARNNSRARNDRLGLLFVYKQRRNTFCDISANLFRELIYYI